MGLLETRVERGDRRTEAVNARSQSALDSVGSDVLSPALLSSDEATSCCGAQLRPFWADDGRYISVCMRCGTEYGHRQMARFNGSPWIGVDLDGTLAQETGDAKNPDDIGEPVEPMVERLRQWLADGKTVKIFTARASVPRQVELVKQWLKDHGLPDLEVTNVKDFKMMELWDDRAVQVTRNSGQPMSSSTPHDTADRTAPGITIQARRKSGGSFVSKLRMFFAL